MQKRRYLESYVNFCSIISFLGQDAIVAFARLHGVTIVIHQVIFRPGFSVKLFNFVLVIINKHETPLPFYSLYSINMKCPLPFI
jgi:hypothetical protein